jgi:tRNA(Arg) A34 adenosine deaminase TadA
MNWGIGRARLDQGIAGRHMTVMADGVEGQDPMELALAEASAAAARDEVPIGAVVVDAASGRIVAHAGNRVEELKDPTAHAEMLVLREAANVVDAKRLPEFDLYVTLEPCPMCAQAASFARVRRLVFAAEDVKGGGVINGARIFDQSSCFHRPEIRRGRDDQADRSAELLRGFFRVKRDQAGR